MPTDNPPTPSAEERVTRIRRLGLSDSALADEIRAAEQAAAAKASEPWDELASYIIGRTGHPAALPSTAEERLDAAKRLLDDRLEPLEREVERLRKLICDGCRDGVPLKMSKAGRKNLHHMGESAVFFRCKADTDE